MERDNDNGGSRSRISSGFDDFADGKNASVSPRRKRPIQDFRGIRDQKFQGRMTKNQK